MDAGSRDIKISTHKGGGSRNIVSDFIFKILCNFGNHFRSHTVKRAAQRGIFKHHRFERYIAGALADTEQRAVDGTRAIQPRGSRIGNRLVKIIVPVPL